MAPRPSLRSSLAAGLGAALFSLACGPGEAQLPAGQQLQGVADSGYSVRLVSLSGLPDKLAPGGRYVVSAVLENNGSLPFDPSLDRLVSENYPFDLWGWAEQRLPPGRVRPGQGFVLSFAVIAPLQGNKVRFAASMHHWAPNPDERGFFADRARYGKTGPPLIDLELLLDRRQPRAFDARLKLVSPGGPWDPGMRDNLVVEAENVGSQPWSGAGFALMSAGQQAFQVSTVRLGPTEQVAPGDRRRFVVPLEAPAAAGRYSVGVQLAHVGLLGYFGDSLGLEVVVGCEPSSVELELFSMDQRQAFLEQLYLDLLRRPLDQVGLRSFLQLAGDAPSRAAIARLVATSSEHQALLVRAWFVELLGRVPDPAELGFFVQILQHGGTRQQALSYLLGGEEYYVQAGNDDNAFNQALVRHLLHREPEAEDTKPLSDLLALGLPRDQVAAHVLSSPEFLGRSVDLYFRALLGRLPDPAARQSLVLALQSGSARDEDLLAALAGSTEYLSRVPELWLDAGSAERFALADIHAAQDMEGVKSLIEWWPSFDTNGEIEPKGDHFRLFAESPFQEAGRYQVTVRLTDGRCELAAGTILVGVR